MKIRILLIISTALVVFQTTFGQEYKPVELAQKIFGKDTLFNIKPYCTGEYQGEPNGRNINPKVVLKFVTLGLTDSTAVIAMTITDSTGVGIDTYLHFQKDTTWKICAFRALAMTAMLEKMLNDLEKMTDTDIENAIKQSKKAKTEDAKFLTSREDYNYQIGNIRLTLELDENIIKHFKTNYTIFDSLKSEALLEIKRRSLTPANKIDLLKSQKTKYRSVFISNVLYGDFEVCRSCVTFYIGGILDNTVGYIYAPDKADLPKMSPDNVIMLKEIAGGWYIFKTT